MKKFLVVLSVVVFLMGLVYVKLFKVVIIFIVI